MEHLKDQRESQEIHGDHWFCEKQLYGCPPVLLLFDGYPVVSQYLKRLWHHVIDPKVHRWSVNQSRIETESKAGNQHKIAINRYCFC